MYSPPLGTFLSKDPLIADPMIMNDNNWFGAALSAMKNAYRYGDNNPVNSTDPSGLITVTKLEEKIEKCGGWTAKFAFRLDKPATCVGYMFQKVEVYEGIVDCTSCQGCPGPKELQLVDRFWEMFSEIRVGQQDDNILRTLKYSDIGQEQDHPNTCGGNRVVREIRFICAKDIIQSGENPTKWPKGKDAGIPTGNLPATRAQPKFWGKFQEVGNRTTSDFWNCCK